MRNKRLKEDMFIMRNIYIEKKEKLMLAIYMILIFSASYIFYTKVEPIMICDTDDWNYISSTRLAIPLWGNWNPSKVFPETLMGLCGFFAAYVIYPLLGDYIFSLTYVFAFVVSTFIVLYIAALLFFVKKILSMTMQGALVCSLIAYLLHFLFMLHPGTNNIFMFTASNLNCFANYTIPALLCLILALYFVQKYLFDSNSLLHNENLSDRQNIIKIGVMAFLIYLCIFSNMVCNIIIIAPFIYMFSTIFLRQIKDSGIKKVFSLSNIKRYALFIYVFGLELICLIFEYNGGRAQDLNFSGGAICDIIIDIKYILVSMNKKVAVICVILIFSAIFTYICRKRRNLINGTDSIYAKALRIILFSFILILFYILLLYIRIGLHKLQRAENIFVIYIFFGSAVTVSIGYILNLYRKMWILVPIVLYMMVTTTIFGDYKQSISYYLGDTELCYMVNNNIIEQYKHAEYMGLDNFDLHVPESGLGSYPHTANVISNTLYKHGITSKRIQANMVLESIDYFFGANRPY